jgi:hypothetical protein
MWKSGIVGLSRVTTIPSSPGKTEFTISARLEGETPNTIASAPTAVHSHPREGERNPT